MKKIFQHLAGVLLPLVLLLSLAACSAGGGAEQAGLQVATTTYPLYLLASAVAEGAENLTITPVVNQSVACLHDYTLTVTDMKVLERSDLILVNGAGLEDFLASALNGQPTVDCSQNVRLLEEDGETDPHIWMDPDRAAQMVLNIAEGLAEADPTQADLYRSNAQALATDLQLLTEECRAELADLTCRQLITFHEGFAYLAESMNLELLAAIEEEAGSEASAKEIVHMVNLIEEYHLPAIFVEINGSTATASAIQRECGVALASLSMLMSGPEEYSAENNYQTLYRSNIQAIKEALQ